MRRCGFALLTVLALSPAHAALIEYSFESRVLSRSPEAGDAFGVEIDSTITGGFLFDDAAPRISYVETPVGGCCFPPGIATASTYDMSNLLLWVNLGDYVLTASGDQLAIVDGSTHPTLDDRWRLGAHGDGHAVNGFTVASMGIELRHANGPLTSSALQVTNAADWGFPFPGNRSFSIGFTDGAFVSSSLLSITPTSVPEPGTLSLLAVGLLGTLAARRRRRAPACPSAS